MAEIDCTALVNVRTKPGMRNRDRDTARRGIRQMGRFDVPDHPEISWIERTGYPSWMQETEDLDDEDFEEPEVDYED